MLLAALINMHTFMQTSVALFELGSKMSHSCTPNLSYSSAFGDSMSVFVSNHVQRGVSLLSGSQAHRAR